MSIKTWKKEFYPITAKQAAKMSLVKAVEHSIQKWTGLQGGNLKKHGLHSDHHTKWILDDNDNFCIDEITCALCMKFVAQSGNCKGCPLFESLGHRCDDSSKNPPYQQWTYNNNPAPMIKALRKALKWVEQNS